MSKPRLISFVIYQWAWLLMSPAMADHASALFATGTAGAVMTVPGATLPQGTMLFSVGAQFVSMDEIADAELEALGAADEDVHSTGSLLQLAAAFAHGITDDLTVGASLPYIERRDIRAADHHMGTGEVEFAGDSAGMGDMNLFAQYRFYRNDSLDAAIIAGMKFPTGATGQRESSGELFETENQPGSGSWDPFAGLAVDRRFGRAGLSTNIMYTFTGEGKQQTELGDIFNYNAALTYRAWSPEGGHGHHHNHHHGLGIVDYVNLALELNGDLRKRTEINGREDDNSGGHTLYLAPGIRAGLGHRWSVFFSFGIPVIHDLNGSQSEPDYRVISGLSATF